jgi:DNA-binding CsgD family transcriptional regulator
LWNLGAEQARLINSRDKFQVPPAVLEKCREIKAQWNDEMLEHYTLASPTGHPVCHPASPELRARVHLVQRSTGSITKPIFRIHFEEPPARETHGATRAEKELSLGARLTRRERELVELICQGAANKEVATRLGLSLGTVKKELNTLYQKLEVPSRSRLMALMR